MNYIKQTLGPREIFPTLLFVDFFQTQLFEKFFQEYDQSVEQFGSRSGPTWVQTVCKIYQQTTLGDKELILAVLNFFYALHSFPISIQLTCSIPKVSCSGSKVFSKMDISRFNTTRTSTEFDNKHTMGLN